MASSQLLFLTALPAAKACLEAAATKPGDKDHLPVMALIGAPLDRTTSYRSGTHAGPAEVRAASWSLETYSPTLGAELDSTPVYDFGDVALDPSRDIEADLEAIEKAVRDIAERGFVPLMIGGEHLATLPAFKAVWSVAGGGASPRNGGSEPIVVLHYDAHADLRDEFEGLYLSHATVLRRVAEISGPRNLYQFGIRSGSREEMVWGDENVNRPPGPIGEATRKTLSEIAGRRVYLTVDIDLFDPAHAPGTGSPEPGGPSAVEAFSALVSVGLAASLGARGGGIDLVGADLVEVSPPLDPSGRTTVLAAKLLREFLIARDGGGSGK